jgi:hypothetical protein
MKCLECEFHLTEPGEGETADISVESTENNKCIGEMCEINNGNEMNNKCNDTNNSDETEQDNTLCSEDTMNQSPNNGTMEEVEKNEGKNLDLEVLNRSMRSRLCGPNTQPPGSKKIPGRNLENNFCPSSRKYESHLCTC